MYGMNFMAGTTLALLLDTFSQVQPFSRTSTSKALKLKFDLLPY
jgi:hypothetical protein